MLGGCIVTRARSWGSTFNLVVVNSAITLYAVCPLHPEALIFNLEVIFRLGLYWKGINILRIQSYPAGIHIYELNLTGQQILV